jgi:quercetin dioxygenase-like cupin family protein
MIQTEKKIEIPAKRRKKSAEGLAESMACPKLQFDLKEELKQLHKEQTWLETGRNAKTLVKYPDFRIVLTLMKAGKRMQEHKAKGRISIHSLTGHIRLHLGEEIVDLPAGQLLALERAVPHDVEALEESAFLISISWSKGN